MPLLSRLDFTHRAFDVSYRAAEVPQEVHLEVATSGPPALGSAIVTGLVALVNLGGAGGAEFPPTTGLAEIVSAPVESGTTHSAMRFDVWVLRIGGVSPFFLRNVVEHMRLAGAEFNLESFLWRGAKPLDASELSVDTQKIRAWLENPQVYPQAYQHSEFPVRFASADDLKVRVRCRDVITPARRDQLEETLARWLGGVGNIIGDHGGEVDLSRRNSVPLFARAKHEFRALFAGFPHAVGPALAMLSNMLYRFHCDHGQVLELEFGG